MVASNGAVIFRYPPLEVVHEETFDARDAVAAVLREHPEALVAVEERGVGYRVNRPFPPGELSGEMIETAVDSLLEIPVSRVIIRDPSASAEDFVAMAARLGLHGTDYVVGWTAWLDLAPVGVSKASGLEHVASELGLTAADVLAIGDGRNDIEMLRWAARGVAMGQSVPEVHEAADATTETVYDDGAAVELRRWFLSSPRTSVRRPRAAAARADHPRGRRGDAGRASAGCRGTPTTPARDDVDAASMVRADSADPSWGPRHVVRAFDSLAMGSIGFFGPPSAADDEVPEAQVGFGLVEEARGHGAMTEALTALLEQTDRLGVRVRASVPPENRASLRVLAKCRFTQLRGADPDGALVMVRPLPG